MDKEELLEKISTDLILESGIYLEPWDDMFGKSRRIEVVNSRRKVALYLRLRGWTYQDIGELFNRDHATILHTLKNITQYPYYGAIVRGVKTNEGFVPVGELQAALNALKKALPTDLEVRGVNLHECTTHEAMEYGKAIRNKLVRDSILLEIERLEKEIGFLKAEHDESLIRYKLKRGKKKTV